MNTSIAPGIELDAEGDILTIDGIKYARSLFKTMATMPVDQPNKAFQIIKREDGIITLQTIALPYGAAPVLGEGER